MIHPLQEELFHELSEETPRNSRDQDLNGHPWQVLRYHAACSQQGRPVDVAARWLKMVEGGRESQAGHRMGQPYGISLVLPSFTFFLIRIMCFKVIQVPTTTFDTSELALFDNARAKGLSASGKKGELVQRLMGGQDTSPVLSQAQTCYWRCFWCLADVGGTKFFLYHFDAATKLA